MTQNNHQNGHRARIKEKFLKAKDKSHFENYELLELLLTYCIPRKDVKPIAKNLIKKFGSFKQIINSDRKELQKIENVGQGVGIFFDVINELIVRDISDELKQDVIENNIESLIKLLKLKIGQNKIEEFKVVFLDINKKFICEETLTTGTVDSTSIYPREVIKIAMDYNASYIILVHNHPSGNLNPSDTDILATKKIMLAGEMVNIKLYDHIIITKNSYFSFRENDYI